MADKLNVSLVSPERELFTGQVDQVDLPGSEGDLGILPNHAPLMAALTTGVSASRATLAKTAPRRCRAPTHALATASVLTGAATATPDSSASTATSLRRARGCSLPVGGGTR